MSIVHKFNAKAQNFFWQGIQPQPLEAEGVRFVTKHVLIGENEEAPRFIMRYFQVEPQGHSRLERHPQEHEAIILQGKGEVQIGAETIAVEPYDAVFISGNELHQFRNTADVPLGFICIIPKQLN